MSINEFMKLLGDAKLSLDPYAEKAIESMEYEENLGLNRRIKAIMWLATGIVGFGVCLKGALDNWALAGYHFGSSQAIEDFLDVHMPGD